MVECGLWVRLEAKPGKEQDLASFLRASLAAVQQEPGTLAWFAVRLGPFTFGIFDAFPSELGRQAHLSGKVAAGLTECAPELLSGPPVMERLEVIAAKLRG